MDIVSEVIETELKLRFRRSDLETLRQKSCISNALNVATSQQLQSIYFDSEDRLLLRHGVVLRVRRDGDRFVQTVKATGRDGDWLNRSEWEHETASNKLDLAALMESPLGSLLADAAQESLKPIFETRVKRIKCLLDLPGTSIEVAIDQGEIVAGDKRMPIAEIELELKRGYLAEVFKLAREIGAAVPLEIEAKSKSERGYDLVDHAATHSEKIRNPVLSPDTSAGTAFTTISRACLRHLLINEAGILVRDAEALHQVRVALRRLRAAMSLFRGVVADERLNAIKAEVKWMGQEIGPARDLDVFISEALRPLRRQYPKDTTLADIGRYFAHMRLN